MRSLYVQKYFKARLLVPWSCARSFQIANDASFWHEKENNLLTQRFAHPSIPAKADVCSVCETLLCSYNKYDQSQGGYEEAVMMGDPPAKEYNTYMMQVIIFVMVDVVTLWLMKTNDYCLNGQKYKRRFCRRASHRMGLVSMRRWVKIENENIFVDIKTIIPIFRTRAGPSYSPYIPSLPPSPHSG